MTARLLLLTLMFGPPVFLGGCSQVHSRHLVCRLVPCRAAQRSDATKPWPDCDSENLSGQADAVQHEDKVQGARAGAAGRWADENGPQDCSF
jgi:hypothetical protein